MSAHFDKALDALDAEVFTGDALLSTGPRAALKHHLGRWSRALGDIAAACSIIELDPYTVPALRVILRGADLAIAEIALESHPESVRNELHNYRCYVRAVLQSLGDNVP